MNDMFWAGLVFIFVSYGLGFWRGYVNGRDDQQKYDRSRNAA